MKQICKVFLLAIFMAVIRQMFRLQQISRLSIGVMFPVLLTGLRAQPNSRPI